MNSLLKCIIWDLDDTLWDGALKRDAGEARIRPRALRVLEAADAKGVIQSVASRNDRETALAKLSALGLARFFIFPQIDNYAPKTAGIQKIAERFNIGMDCVAFVDDNEFERYQAKKYFPEISVHAPDADGLAALAAMIAEIPGSFSADRPDLMKIRETRIEAEAAFSGSREEFLAGCKMRLSVRRALPACLPRAAELALRTNRLNNTRERLSEAELAEYFGAPGKFAYVCSLTDIFGDSGVVGVCLLRSGPGGINCGADNEEITLYLDLFCISCRVEGRGVAAAFLSVVLGENGVLREFEAENRPSRILCDYVVNKKDLSAYMLLKGMGFSQAGKDGGRLSMALDLPAKNAAPAWITVEMEE
ncbi:MAG: HAD-IIIC family phosphatase [Defluviitaleaceae bacterium]|nr:HAD-IIIC family phosphatase [Defluviitaleaceae bacterium]